MTVAVNAVRTQKGEDFGLELKLSGETDLERAFLSLQEGQEVLLLPEFRCLFGELYIVFHNRKSEPGK